MEFLMAHQMVQKLQWNWCKLSELQYRIFWDVLTCSRLKVKGRFGGHVASIIKADE
jgi:hypothetical protein